MATEEVNIIIKIYRLAVKNLPILKYSWVLIATICVLAMASYLKIKNTDVFSYDFVVLIVIFLCITLSYFASKTDDTVLKFVIYVVIGSIAFTVVIGVLGFGSFMLTQKPVFYNRWFPNMKDETVGKNNTIEEKDSTNKKDNFNELKKKNIPKKSLKTKSTKSIPVDEKNNLQSQHTSENKSNSYESPDLNSNYKSDKLSGIVKFDYSNNNGKFTIGSGEYIFETMWSKANDTHIHAYKDASTMKTIALVTDKKNIKEVTSANSYDGSSRVRTPRINEIVIWQNVNGYFAATKVISIKDRDVEGKIDELVFEYVINTEKTDSFDK